MSVEELRRVFVYLVALWWRMQGMDVTVDLGRDAEKRVGSISHSHFGVWKEITLKAAPAPTWSSPSTANSSPEVGLSLSFSRDSGPRAECLVGGFPEGIVLGGGAARDH